MQRFWTKTSLSFDTFFQVRNRTDFSKFAYDYCLTDAYSYVLLKDAAGLKNEGKLEFQLKVGST